MKATTTILMGQGDAGIVEWSDAFKNKERLEIILIDPALNEADEIPCAILTFSTQRETAKAFMEFARKEGPWIFTKYGFKTKL